MCFRWGRGKTSGKWPHLHYLQLFSEELLQITRKFKYLAIFRINDRQNHFESIDITIRNILSHVHNSDIWIRNLYSYLDDDVLHPAGRRVAVPGREARVGAAVYQHQLPLLVRRVLVRGKSLSTKFSHFFPSQQQWVSLLFAKLTVTFPDISLQSLVWFSSLVTFCCYVWL